MSQKRRVRRRKPKVQFNRKMNTKLEVLCLVLILALFLLCTRVIFLNKTKGEKYSLNILGQQNYQTTILPYQRGDIKDRNGNVLATSVMVYNLILDGAVINDKDHDYLEPTVNALVKYLGVDEEDVKAEIKKNSDSRYIVYKRNLSYKEMEEFNKYKSGEYISGDKDEQKKQKKAIRNTQGVWFEKHYIRKYPYDNLACTVLGFSNSNNEATIGIEASYSDYLEGVDGREYGYIGTENNLQRVIKEAQNGDDVISSIDMNIQRIVQKSINKYMKKYKPKRIAVVVADPNNGEILAMGDDITFNLNEATNLDKYYTPEEQTEMGKTKKGRLEMSETLNGIWKNFCVSEAYEPGSTIKPFTVAAAYEEGKVDKNTTFFCDGYEMVPLLKSDVMM